jgi:GxxExxY protein
MDNSLPAATELIAKQIVDIAVKIHKALGPGLLESVYEKCFCHELMLRQIPFVSQKPVEIIYDQLRIDKNLKLDILVDDQIIVEIKAQENPHPVWDAQLLSYLKLTNTRLGFLINFDVTIMKNGIKRIIL